MSGDNFGELLRKYRRQANDPQFGGRLTQDRLADFLSVELGITYSRGAVSEWERGRSQIHKDDRNLLISLIKVLYQYGGIENLNQVKEWLAAGNYRALDQTERYQISPEWDIELAEFPFSSQHSQLKTDASNNYLPRQRPQEEQFLLDKVKSFWVEGVLEKSLHGEALIELGKEARPEAVDYPWEMVVQAFDKEPYTLAPDKSIVEVFTEANQSLLILGAPGSGKTTMMLELAREKISQAEQDPWLPIPVVFNLSSWTGARSLVEWLVDELGQKYLFPKKFSHPWLEDDKLLILLDGLDEVDPKYQLACIEAIDEFQQEHLAGMVVCSRMADYEAITRKLKLETAIFLQPLTRQQIDTYLVSSDKELEAIRSLIKKDAGFEELAKSPLMLSIMSLAYQGISVEELSKIVSTDERRQHLLATYVQQMFRRRGVSSLYSREQTIHWLSWLANGMAENDSTVFYIEFLQPSWLTTRLQRWLYLLVTRLIGGFYIWIILWLNLLIGGLVGRNSPLELPPEFAMPRADSSSIVGYFQDPILPVVFSVALGFVVIGYIVFYEREKDSRAAKNSMTRWYWSLIVGLFVIFITLYTFAMFGRLFDRYFSSLVISFALWEGFGFFIASHYVYGTTYRDDISTTETISWSWKDAMKGMVSGLIIGIIITLNPTPALVISYDITLSNLLGFGLLFWLLGQVRRESIVNKSRPNQGIWLSAKNGVKIGLIFSLSFGVFYLVPALFLGWNLLLAVFGGIVGALVGLLIYGSINVINHFFLRFLLWANGSFPWNIARFLDHAVERIFLRKVGGGYIFVHRTLLDYFSKLITQ